MDTLTLDRLPLYRCGRVLELLHKGNMGRRLIELGVVEGSEIECVGRSPSGDPSAYLIRGAVIAIRAKDARKIVLRFDEVVEEDGTY